MRPSLVTELCASEQKIKKSFHWFIIRHFLSIITHSAACSQQLTDTTHNTQPHDLTWMTRMFSPVSWASCSLMCRVGFGVATNAAFNVSSCLALMVVRGPRLLVPEFCSSFSILFVSLSEDVELSVSLMSSCIGSCRSGDKLLSVHDDTGGREGKINKREVTIWKCQRGGGGGGGWGGGREGFI